MILLGLYLLHQDLPGNLPIISITTPTLLMRLLGRHTQPRCGNSELSPTNAVEQQLIFEKRAETVEASRGSVGIVVENG